MKRSTTFFGLLLAAVGVAWGAWSWSAWTEGAALYAGQPALVARVSGHDEPLPSHASACGNCHAASLAAATASIAPPLLAATLTQAVARRGGPPSRYDLQAFCRLLRTGVDPAQVLVARAMPRFDIGDEACTRLWDFVSSR